ncbi:MAG: V-type ATP synthase subunit E family protein [Defluviitaleaceae bacterium]|nr:V-type ATP synthase subunit E family protein [Defluviitaleaceae bacterium]
MSERKIAYFAEIIGREVTAKKRRAKHQLANDLSKDAAKAIEAAIKKVDSQVAATRRQISRNENKKISEAITHEKASYFAMRNSHHAKLLDEVTEDLKLFTTSAEYESYLTERINEAKSKHSFAAAVKIRPEDMFFKQKIEEATGLKPLPGESDYIGGFILQNENGKISADYTFRTRLKEVEI